MFENKKIKINVNDLRKVSVVTAVMMQTILSFALANSHSATNTAFLGTFYVIVKYIASMFIFAIVYNMVKTNQHLSYWEFLKEKFLELVVPYLLWTTVYLWLFPAVQQQTPYMDTVSFLLKYVTGDGAPHLWYTVMMLQIQLFMPFFVWFGYKVLTNKKYVQPVLIGPTISYVAWHLFYQTQVLTGPHHDSQYLLDRSAASFMIYGTYGAVAFVYHEKVYQYLDRVRCLFLPVGLVIAFFSIRPLLARPGDLSSVNAPYLNTIQSLYSLVIIFAVSMGASKMIINDSPKLPLPKWLSVYAYRMYLVNVFVLQVLLLLFKDSWLQLPSGLMILVAYLMMTSCASALNWLPHIIWAAIKKRFNKQ